MADWDKAKAAALKILGAKAQVPDLPPTVGKASDEFDKANDAFKASREDCESKLLDIENANDAFKNAVKQFMAQVEKSNFQLDPKNDAKKIQQAEKLLTAELKAALKIFETNEKMLDELDKHLIQMNKYKAPPQSI